MGLLVLLPLILYGANGNNYLPSNTHILHMMIFLDNPTSYLQAIECVILTLLHKVFF